MDSITLIKGVTPQAGSIPSRFHLYWAGTDQDGAVVGYYWAVVETLPPTGGDSPPRLPGPHIRDYHFTTRTDSTFIFSVNERFPDRQHAFYVYSVDNEGKPDPTPARFIFNAEDRFTPLAVFDQARATGTVYFFDNGVLRSQVRTFDIRDSLTLRPAANDTVPAGSRLTFRFHAEARQAGIGIKGFRYKLDEAQLQPSAVDSFYHKNIVEYRVPPAEADPSREGRDTVPIAPGDKIFTLRVIDAAGGGGLPDYTRRFQINFSPDTWYAGPDSVIADQDAAAGGVWHNTHMEFGNNPPVRYALLSRIKANGPAGLPGTYLNADSVNVLPAHRGTSFPLSPYVGVGKPSKTFIEIWSDTVYMRREQDTVHLGSWAVFFNGGFDPDSKYAVNVADGIEILMPPPLFPGGVVLAPDTANGSPIGFRTRVTTTLTGSGQLSSTAQSKLYPAFNPNDARHFPRIAAYHAMVSAGESYSLQRAEDADGARDNRVDDARSLVQNSPPNDPLRALVLVFKVDFPPEFDISRQDFTPSVTAPYTTFTDLNWQVNVPAIDGDPYVSGDPPGGKPGGLNQSFRWRFTVTGQNSIGGPIVYHIPNAFNIPDPLLPITIPNDNLAPGPCVLTVEVCDCTECEQVGGQGRCVTMDIPVLYQPTGQPSATTGRPGQN